MPREEKQGASRYKGTIYGRCRSPHKGPVLRGSSALFSHFVPFFWEHWPAGDVGALSEPLPAPPLRAMGTAQRDAQVEAAIAWGPLPIRALGPTPVTARTPNSTGPLFWCLSCPVVWDQRGKRVDSALRCGTRVPRAKSDEKGDVGALGLRLHRSFLASQEHARQGAGYCHHDDDDTHSCLSSRVPRTVLPPVQNSRVALLVPDLCMRSITVWGTVE